jgi:C-terminal processing protease CtpA/Prc
MTMKSVNLSNPDDVRTAIAWERHATIQKYKTRMVIAAEQVRHARCRHAKREETKALEQLYKLVVEAIEEGSRAGLGWIALSRISSEKKDDLAALFQELAEQATSEVQGLLRSVIHDVRSGTPP